MSFDKSNRSTQPVLNSLREMLGLQGDAFVSAMKEAVWVPGGVDQLADIIIRSLSPDDQYRLTQELPDEPEVMALIGRLLIALNEHPKRRELGQEVLARAEKLGDRGKQFLSPYHWYPPTEQIETILVAPHRLHAPSLMVRMQWGGRFAGIEAVWMIRFASGDLGEVYFVTNDADIAALNDLEWTTISMDQALGLITSVGMVQSLVQQRFPFDGMAGVGLWMVLAGGREVAPWIDAVFALEADPLSAQETALAEINALAVGDYLAAFDLLDPSVRPQDVLDFVRREAGAARQTGELWRLDAGPEVPDGDGCSVSVRGWYRTKQGIVDRAYQLRLCPDPAAHWRIVKLEVAAEANLDDAEINQYLVNNPRYLAHAEVLDLEELAATLPEPPLNESEHAVHFAAGPDYDMRKPFDLAANRELEWTIMLGDEPSVLIWASNELSMRRELARLQDEEAIGEVLQTANVDLITMDAIQSACDRGPDAAQALLDALSD